VPGALLSMMTVAVAEHVLVEAVVTGADLAFAFWIQLAKLGGSSRVPALVVSTPNRLCRSAALI